MALMVPADLPGVLAEIHRVLAPGGALIATVPANRALRPADRGVLVGLFTALGRRLHDPNDDRLTQLPALLASADVRPIADNTAS